MDDIVVVEILKEPGHKKDLQKQDGSANTNLAVTEGLAYGQVVGLLERIRYPEVDHPVLYCTLDDMEGHLMRPLCKTVPKIHVMNDTVRNQHKDLLKTRIEIKTITPNGDIEHRGFQDVRPSERELYVFKVAILNWRQKSLYPLGAVLDCHMSGRDYASGLKVLLMQQRVPTIYPQEVINNTNDILQGGDLSADGREVLTDRLVFTIDPPGSVDLDDALSVWKEGTHYVVGVHIADVALVVQEGSAVDEEARKRAATFYPRLCKPHRMLPEPIGTEMCSLLPEEERPALSVFYRFNDKLNQVGDPEVKKTNFCQAWGNRKKTCMLFIPFEDPRLVDSLDDDMKSKEAHALVEELMILTNSYIAKRLRSKCLEDGKIEEARKIAFMDDLHPLQCLANSHWMQIMETAQYKCSYGLNQLDHFHFGLDMAHYTHFTSPIRRYADLHIHRLLHADLNGEIPTCTPDDVTNLCREISSAKSRQKVFQKGCRSLKIADSLQRQPLVFRTFVDQVDSEQLTLTVPSLRAVSDRKQELPFSILGWSISNGRGLQRIKQICEKSRENHNAIRTGKTYTGMKLVYLFCKINRQLEEGKGKKTVLFCGPSNKSVDLVASTHSDKPYAERIAAFEKLFQQSPSSVDNNVLQKYYKLLRKASVEELGNYEVVMIDECAMSPEPHSLVPIIATKARQVVLIGDHKQLRPIITCQAAAELGLEQSLFERLYDRNDVPRMFLNVQYRMHPQICEFPSQEFYEGKLRTGRFKYREDEQPLPFWPRDLQTNEEVPHILVDVRGEEEAMSVSTDEGNERSKSNVLEAEKVMEILSFFKLFEIELQYIKVLTQYNAQRHLLEQKMKQQAEERTGRFNRYDKDKSKHNASTVVSSQEPHPTHGWCRQNLGFITDKNQVNVALTRAKKGIIIVDQDTRTSQGAAGEWQKV
nr:hypothetical protein BaRGS_028339 [Batillaria attramentaria]